MRLRTILRKFHSSSYRRTSAGSFLLALLFLTGMVTATRAQQTESSKDSDKPTLKTHANSSDTAPIKLGNVTLPILLRTKNGSPLPAIQISDLTLSLEGKPATVTAIQSASSEPLRLCVVVDTSIFLKDQLKAEKQALDKFLTNALQNPDDKVCILHFDTEVELMVDFTHSKDRIERALNELEPGAAPQSGHAEAAQSGNNSDNEDSEIRRPRRPVKALNDALYLTADDIFRGQKGRKVLVILSDGIDFSSKETLISATESLQRSQALTFAIYSKGDYSQWNRNQNNNRQGRSGGGGRSGGIGFPGGGGWPGGGGGIGNTGGGGRSGGESRPANLGTLPDGRKTLEKLTDKTGGRLIEEGKKNSFDDIFNGIALDLRNLMFLTFTPIEGHSDYRRVEVLDKDKNIEVYGPEGYYEK
jgi:VWFA-related protein